MLRWTRPSTAALRARSWNVRRIAFGVTFLPRERCWQTSLNGLVENGGATEAAGLGRKQEIALLHPLVGYVAQDHGYRSMTSGSSARWRAATHCEGPRWCERARRR